MNDDRLIPIWACGRWGQHEHDWLDCYACLQSYDAIINAWDLDPPTVAKAVAVAQVIHAGDKRDNNHEPYINHCLRVMNSVMLHPELRGDDEAAIIAALHDTWEDHPERIDYDELVNLFGERIAQGVQDLTNIYTHAKYPDINRENRKLLERQRLAKVPRRSKIIKMLDVQDNLRSCFPMSDDTAKFSRVFATEKLALLEVIGESHIETYYAVKKLGEEVLECASDGRFS